jgi:hypothetical protein
VGTVLAIEPDPRQATLLREVVCTQVGSELVLVDSIAVAITTLDACVPDLILLPALLSPREESRLLDRLRDLDDAEHLQTLSIPLLASEPDKGDERPWRLLGGRKRRSRGRMSGCDPAIFADQVREYLDRAREARETASYRRRDSRAAIVPAMEAGTPASGHSSVHPPATHDPEWSLGSAPAPESASEPSIEWFLEGALSGVEAAPRGRPTEPAVAAPHVDQPDGDWQETHEAATLLDVFPAAIDSPVDPSAVPPADVETFGYDAFVDGGAPDLPFSEITSSEALAEPSAEHLVRADHPALEQTSAPADWVPPSLQEASLQDLRDPSIAPAPVLEEASSLPAVTAFSSGEGAQAEPPPAAALDVSFGDHAFVDGDAPDLPPSEITSSEAVADSSVEAGQPDLVSADPELVQEAVSAPEEPVTEFVSASHTQWAEPETMFGAQPSAPVVAGGHATAPELSETGRSEPGNLATDWREEAETVGVSEHQTWERWEEDPAPDEVFQAQPEAVEPPIVLAESTETVDEVLRLDGFDLDLDSGSGRDLPGETVARRDPEPVPVIEFAAEDPVLEQQVSGETALIPGSHHGLSELRTIEPATAPPLEPARGGTPDPAWSNGLTFVIAPETQLHILAGPAAMRRPSHPGEVIATTGHHEVEGHTAAESQISSTERPFAGQTVQIRPGATLHGGVTLSIVDSRGCCSLHGNASASDPAAVPAAMVIDGAPAESVCPACRGPLAGQVSAPTVPEPSAAVEPTTASRKSARGPLTIPANSIAPTALWLQRSVPSAPRAQVSAGEPEPLQALSLRSGVAGVTFARGCRLRRVRTAKRRGQPTRTPGPLVIISKRLLAETRATGQAAGRG